MRSLATWALPRVKRHSRICLLVVAAAVVGGGAWAIAAVPDSHGVIHACYPVRSPGSKVPTANATLRVIDPSAGQSCNTAAGATVPEASISWHQIGRQGRPGAPRPSCSRVGHVALKEGMPSSHKIDFDIIRLSVFGKRGPTSPRKLKVTKRHDGVSTDVFKSVLKGETFQKGRVDLYKPGTSAILTTYTLKQVILSSFTTDSCGQDKPTETIVIEAAKGTP